MKQNKQKVSILSILSTIFEWLFFVLGILIILEGIALINSAFLIKGVTNIAISFPLLYPVSKINSNKYKKAFRLIKIILIFLFYGFIRNL